MKLGFDQLLMAGISELPEVIQQILILIILFYHIVCVFLKYTIYLMTAIKSRIS